MKELTVLDTPIFDEMVITELEGHLDDTIPCWAEDAEADHRLTMRCCGFAILECAAHYSARLQWLDGHAPANLTCDSCEHEWSNVTELTELARVVRL